MGPKCDAIFYHQFRCLASRFHPPRCGNRILEEQTLDAEQKKLNLGASTIFNVILVQRDLANAQSAEVAALGNYSKARVQLDFASAQTLVNNNISVPEAFQGQVSRPPSALPPEK